MELSEAIIKPRVDDVLVHRCANRALIGSLSNCRENLGSGRRGSLAVTGHHLIFSVDDADAAAGEREVWVSAHFTPHERRTVPPRLDRPFRLRSAVNKRANTSAERSSPNNALWLVRPWPDAYAISHEIGKDLMVSTFEVRSPSDAHAVVKSIEVLSNLSALSPRYDDVESAAELRLHYSFFHRIDFAADALDWTRYGMRAHFAHAITTHSDKWRVSTVNEHYELCATYPEHVVVPAAVTDETLRLAAKHRVGQRFPVLAYYHAPTKGCIARCSQPLVGTSKKRNRHDEQSLNAIISTGNAFRGYIVDTRSQPAADAQTAKGGGHELEIYYSRWKRIHCGVPRWTQLKEALSKLVEACVEVGNDRFYARLSSSNWMQCVCDALSSAVLIGQCMLAEGMPVVVHGSEGTDTTLLTVALAILIVEPTARTIDGLCGLIQREWIDAGHAFTTRLSHVAFAVGAKTGPLEAPTFLAFLDAVRQLMHQFPHAFEFRETLLIDMYDHACASSFGTFLGDSPAQRDKAGVAAGTTCLWSHIRRPSIRAVYTNAYYTPSDSPLWASTAPQSLVSSIIDDVIRRHLQIVWERMYLRWQRDWTERDEADECAIEVKLEEMRLANELVAMNQGRQ